MTPSGALETPESEVPGEMRAERPGGLMFSPTADDAAAEASVRVASDALGATRPVRARMHRYELDSEERATYRRFVSLLCHHHEHADDLSKLALELARGQ